VEVRWERLRRTPRGYVVVDLTISEGDVAAKYTVYLRDSVQLVFHSTDRSRVELAVYLLKLAGVGAEVKEVGNLKYLIATTNMLAAGREELRSAIAEVIRRAVENGWVDEKRARRWLRKLERGRTLKVGWPKYVMRQLDHTLKVIFATTNPYSVAREVQRLRKMGLVEGVHFTVKMPKGGRPGYVRLLKKGLKRIAWLSAHGSGKQRKLAAEFVEYVLQRAKEEGEEVYERVRKIVEEGRARGFLPLEGFERIVEVDGRWYTVKVLGGGAWLERDKRGRALLRVEVVAEVDGVRGEYALVFYRYGRGVAKAVAKGADPERLAALLRALMGKKPRMYWGKDGPVVVTRVRDLEGLSRFAELADAIEEWLSRQLTDDEKRPQKRDFV
jgi:hypothetical protein